MYVGGVNMKLKVIDLFCGCGGFTYGFDYLDDTFEVIFALDKWKVACESYSVNYPNVEIVCKDALRLKPEDIPDADVIIGSPPCQDFSIANLKRKEDPTLINWFWKVVEEKKPRYIIMEEVPRAKYYVPSGVKIRIYKMCDYGIPQIRRRLFAGEFPEPTKSPINVTFPAVMATEYKGVGSKRQMTRLSKIFRRKSLIPEAKLVQTFPIDYYLAGNLKEQYIQIGNAVPPLMSYRLAEAIKRDLEGNSNILSAFVE